MGSNENQAYSNEASSSTINSTSTSNISFSILSSLVFITPIKLTNNNYLLWQSQAIAIINANELEDLIDNTKSPPNRVVIYVDNDQTVVTSPNPQFQIRRKNDQQLLCWLLSTLREQVLSAVIGAKSSLDVWQILSTQFGTRSRSRVLYLRAQIQTIRKGSMNFHEYYTKMKTTMDALRAAGNNMSDDDFVLCLLASLGSEYDSIIITINVRSESTTLSYAYGMLLSHENTIEYQYSVSHMDYQANFAYRKENQRRYWQSNFNISGNGNYYGGRQFRNPNGNGSDGKQFGGGNSNQAINFQDKTIMHI